MYNRKDEASNVSSDHWIFKDEETPIVEPLSFDYRRASGGNQSISFFL